MDLNLQYFNLHSLIPKPMFSFPSTIPPQSNPKIPNFILKSSNLSAPNTPFPPKRTIIVSARKNSIHNSSLRISTKAALKCAFFIASSLKIFPEPVNLMIKEGFEGGNGNGGGGLGFWNGPRGGGGGWRRKKPIWGFVGLLGVAIAFVVLMLGKNFGGFGELGFGVLGLGFLWILERDWKRGVKGWCLGFCSCALLVVLGFKREELQKWWQRSRVYSPVMDLFKRRPRRRFL